MVDSLDQQFRQTLHPQPSKKIGRCHPVVTARHRNHIHTLGLSEGNIGCECFLGDYPNSEFPFFRGYKPEDDRGGSRRTKMTMNCHALSSTCSLLWFSIVGIFLYRDVRSFQNLPLGRRPSVMTTPTTTSYRIISIVNDSPFSSTMISFQTSHSEDVDLEFQSDDAYDDADDDDDNNRSSEKEEKEEDDNEDIDTSFIDPKFVARNKRWVIVVDDEESIRMAVGDFLYDQGFQVTACADVDSMLQLSSSTSSTETTNDGQLLVPLPRIPDCIVSDIRMPGGKDGIELLRMIRSDPLWETVPVVLLTAKGLSKDRIQGYKAGADAYLPKPFDPEELLSIVDNLILRRQQMMSGQQNKKKGGGGGNLLEIKEDIVRIKEIMKRNSINVVKKTNVYLTNKERDVLEFLCQGWTNSEIADELNANLSDINRIVQTLRTKSNSRNRTELVRWAITTGYVSPRS